jgi:hypothetical protein
MEVGEDHDWDDSPATWLECGVVDEPTGTCLKCRCIPYSFKLAVWSQVVTQAFMNSPSERSNGLSTGLKYLIN